MSVFPVDGATAVRVDVQMGRVDVIAVPREDVTVTVLPSNPARAGDRAAAEAVRADRVGTGTIAVKGPYRLSLLGPGDSVDVVVEVPEASDVAVTVKYGAARLAGRLAAVRAEVPYGELVVDAADRLEVKGGHGDYRIGQVGGDAELAFKSGTARIGRVRGRLRLTGADGAVVVDHADGPAELATSSGSLEVGTAASGATIRSAYGRVRLLDVPSGAVRIDGSYGDVEVGVRRGTAVWLDAAAQHGVVRTDLAADAGPGEGEQALELRIRTGYGSIAVHRSEGPPPED
jgi:hypothetical protein